MPENNKLTAVSLHGSRPTGVVGGKPFWKSTVYNQPRWLTETADKYILMQYWVLAGRAKSTV
jgi:hypothetical protein